MVAEAHDGSLRYKDQRIKDLVEGHTLDIGCGRMKHGDVCVDVEDYGAADIVVDQGEPYPFDDGTFDTVVCSEVLEHVKNPGFILEEMTRVVKPDGSLILSIPNSGNILYRLGLWRQRTSLGPPHVNFWDENAFRDVLDDHGIAVQRVIRSWYNTRLILPRLATCLIFVAKTEPR